jgi:glutamate synthase domain-containing protein 1
LGQALGACPKLTRRASHAVFKVAADYKAIEAWLQEHHPDLRIVSAGDSIEIFKEMGLPADVVARFELRNVTGSHALGHTRMATESAVTTEHSHPFSTGLDLCLVMARFPTTTACARNSSAKASNSRPTTTPK